MKRNLLLLLAGLQLCTIARAQLQVTEPRCENRSNPLGIDQRNPQLSWQLQAAERHTEQQAYAIRVGTDSAAVAEGRSLLWNSGKVLSSQSLQVPYQGGPLASGQRYYWQVRVWDNKGHVAGWTPMAYWQMGLLQPGDWQARWITAGFTEDTLQQPSPLFRKTFTAAKQVRSAIAFVTAHGLYQASLNGHRMGNAWLTPGWTSYGQRLQYQVYDVTALLLPGSNAIGVQLGNGWYRGHIGFNGQKAVYGKALALLFQLQLTYTDGSVETIGSNSSWKSATGIIRSSEIYHGECQDARADQTGWQLPGYADASWPGVQEQIFDNRILVATCNQPVTPHETFAPRRVLTTPLGEQVIDFGQNLVGFVRVQLKGNAGDTIRIDHAEVLDKAGNFYTDNLRAARQQNQYVLQGKGIETFEPYFTFQGFRYIRVTGLRGSLQPQDFTAVALYSDMPVTGRFTTSDTLLNQLQHNIQWGQKGNFLDVPTDCPQRDERLGWTGDAQVFSRTACFNMQANNFFAKWLKDLAADQQPDGSVPFVVPNVLGKNAGGSTGWADVSTILPWNLYLAYGDQRTLVEQYASMKAWVEYMHRQSNKDLWNTGFHFGDWLFYRPEDDNDGRSAVTDKYLIAQCFYAHSTQLFANAARVLGKTADATAYTALLQRIRAAFVREYLTPSGRLVSGSQTAYVLALQFNLLPEALRAQAAQRLVSNIRAYGNHLTTGFLGTPYLCHVLSRFGYTQVAYQLLLQQTYPSWLYPVKMGATTIWERWDGQKPDGSFQTPGMNSFNHYAYGAIGDWMYRVMAGLDTDETGPGYRHLRIQPHPGGGLTDVSATLQTGYGQAGVHWHQQPGALLVEVEVPCNTRATILLPAASPTGITESGQPLPAVGLQVQPARAGYVPVRVGSGRYLFRISRK